MGDASERTLKERERTAGDAGVRSSRKDEGEKRRERSEWTEKRNLQSTPVLSVIMRLIINCRVKLYAHYKRYAITYKQRRESEYKVRVATSWCLWAMIKSGGRGGGSR